MTRNEAFLEMASAGKKVTHKWFIDNEYLYVIDDTIYTEDGYNYTARYWSNNDEEWKNGWEIYNKK